MSITTQTGDSGSTALLYNHRVSKTDPRVEACGACDELNVALGMARAHSNEPFLNEPILVIQQELVGLMGELCVLEEDRTRYVKDGFASITTSMVDRLTTAIHDLEKNHRLTFRHWATPGTTLLAACLDQARVVCRRAERRVVALQEIGITLNPEILRYLNRLSDLCWLWARWVETRLEPEQPA